MIRETTAATMRAHARRRGARRHRQAGAARRLHCRRARPARRRKSIPRRAAIPPTQLIASFVGFAPINNPAVTILVQLDSPDGPHEGRAGGRAGLQARRGAGAGVPGGAADVPVSPKTLRAARDSKAAGCAERRSRFRSRRRLNRPLLRRSNAERRSTGAATRRGATASPPTVELAEGDGVAVAELGGQDGARGDGDLPEAGRKSGAGRQRDCSTAAAGGRCRRCDAVAR